MIIDVHESDGDDILILRRKERDHNQFKWLCNYYYNLEEEEEEKKCICITY